LAPQITNIGEINNVQNIIAETTVLVNKLPEAERTPYIQQLNVAQINVNLSQINILAPQITNIGEINNVQNIINTTTVLVNKMPEAERAPYIEQLNVSQVNVNLSQIDILAPQITNIGEINKVQNIINTTTVLVNNMPESERAPYIHQLNVSQVNVNLSQINILVPQITNIGEINNVQKIIAETTVLVNNLPESERAPYIHQLNVAQINVNLSQINILAPKITNIDEINNVQNIIANTTVLVNNLPEADRAPYLLKLNVAQINVNMAQINLLMPKITNIDEINNVQNIIAQTTVLINNLPDGQQKTEFIEKVEQILQKLKIVTAQIKVKTLEETAQSLTNREQVDNAQTLLNEVLKLVNELNDGEIKNTLIVRIEAVQNRINVAIAIKPDLTADKTIITNSDVTVIVSDWGTEIAEAY
jgi:hypothetical protein